MDLNSKKEVQVIIIGGGLAGLVSALHLALKGIEVLIIEKNSYPLHKVCGEYISNEVLPYLKSLGIKPLEMGAVSISKFILTTQSNKVLKTKLPLGGFGMSRHLLDYTLSSRVQDAGVYIIQDTVTNIQYRNNQFFVKTKNNSSYIANIVLGAYGKRSNLDIKLNRSFIKNKSPYLAVKAHYTGNFPEDVVAIHNFEGGYCGVSKVENNKINICYITNYKTFQKFKSIPDFETQVVYKNDALKELFTTCKLTFEKPLSISQISFDIKKPVENHILMCGDTAGMIHPLCGNGMGMAIHSAKLVSELVLQYLKGQIESRTDLEQQYAQVWNTHFLKRVKTGKILAALYNQNKLSQFVLGILKFFPNLLTKIIKSTHGKPLKALEI